MESSFIKSLFSKIKTKHYPKPEALELLKYIGPGLLVTVGFIDPGNWAVNLAAGSTYGYSLLWVVTFSSLMLIIIQHNVAHLGIVTGLCLSEATTKYLPKAASRPILGSAIAASISTSLAEILGGAIALNMLFEIPIKIGACIVTVLCLGMIFSNTYQKTERFIIFFVSLIGLSFLYELYLVDIDWPQAVKGWSVPSMPMGATLIVVSVLGAVVMPHNLFLHSEVIQSRKWNVEDEATIKKQLKYEYFDTIFSMVIGWAINSAMIIMAATTFYQNGVVVDELEQAKSMLDPLLGSNAGFVFALALFFSGTSSTITSGIAGASIFSGMFGEPYNSKDLHSRIGILVSFVPALLLIFLIDNPFQGLIVSQAILSLQLPITVFTQLYLTSSTKVMGKFANSRMTLITIGILGLVVTALNIVLLINL